MNCGLRGNTRGSECNESDQANKSNQQPVSVGRPHTALPAISIPKSNIFYNRRSISAKNGREQKKRTKVNTNACWGNAVGVSKKSGDSAVARSM